MRIVAKDIWLLGAALAVAPPLLGPTLGMSVLTSCCVTAILALSYNLLLGTTGLLSLGHATYGALGGFAAAWAMGGTGGVALLPVPLVPIVGLLAGVVAGGVLGTLCVRKGRVGFSMITLGLGQLVYVAMQTMSETFGGDVGFSVDRGEAPPLFGFSFTHPVAMYATAAAWLVLVVLLLRHLALTPWGRMANAVRDNDERVEYVGYSAAMIRWIAIVLSAGIGGAGGALATCSTEIVTTEAASLAASGMMLFHAYLGGIQRPLGPVAGAFVLTVFSSVTAAITEGGPLYLGLIFVITVLFAPRGLVGLLEDAWAMLLRPPTGRALWRVGAIAAGIGAVVAGGVFAVELGYAAGNSLHPALRVGSLTLRPSEPFAWVLSAGLIASGALTIRVAAAALKPASEGRLVAPTPGPVERVGA